MTNPTITAKSKSGDFELAPAGSHVATCYQMIHIGTVREEYMGEIKTLEKVRIAFELSNELRVFKEGEVEKPMSISKEYTLSFHEKANLRKDLESWRGKGFTEEEIEGFDITQLLGKACILSITHQKAKISGNDYAKIANISGLPKGTEAPTQFNPDFVFSMEEEFDQDKFNTLPEFLRKKIESSEQYRQMMYPESQPVTPAPSGEELNAEANDDLPF